MKKEALKNNQRTKKIIIWSCIGEIIIVGCGALYLNRPLPQGVQCKRSYYREDGKPKHNYSTNIGARSHASYDSIRHHTNMRAYQVPLPNGEIGRFLGHMNIV